MRHLGLICVEARLPHIKQACLIEIIARSAKAVIKKQMAGAAPLDSNLYKRALYEMMGLSEGYE